MKTKATLYLMLIPIVVLWALTFAAPMVIAARLSLFKSSYVQNIFVGLSNYSGAIADRFFRKSFINTAFSLPMIVTPIVFFSYKIASFLSVFGIKTQATMRFMLYVPGLVSGIIIGLLWRWILQPMGLANALLATVGLPGVPWLHEVIPARFAYATVVTLSTIGGGVLILSSIICSIPAELREAARIDGANERKYKKYIQRPIMLPTLLLVVLLNIVGVMQIYESNYMLFYMGGPSGSISTPVYEIFMTAFLFGKRGPAAAKGMILMVVIAVIIALKQRIEKWAKQ